MSKTEYIVRTKEDGTLDLSSLPGPLRLRIEHLAARIVAKQNRGAHIQALTDAEAPPADLWDAVEWSEVPDHVQQQIRVAHFADIQLIAESMHRSAVAVETIFHAAAKRGGA